MQDTALYTHMGLHLMPGSEIGFNPKTDSGDGGAHLNIVGAEKVSRHLGNYLRELIIEM